MKVLVSCANGAGTSLMMKMKVEQAFKELGIDLTEIKHCSISEGKSQARNYDAVFCSQNFTNMFDSAKQQGTKVIGMKNILSVEEAKEKIKAEGLCD
ncbi:MAG: PTS sugar transporter subunit IIB [Tissierellia bacterium]|nr:PTS sugar transporter subunit IIB [Tissierellia bacterium]